jgi:hypothetical protein
MNFDGVVESVGQARVTGWACFDPQGIRVFPKLELRFHSRGRFAPTATPPRHDGLTGFVFQLPEEFQDLPWPEFLADFHGVFAEYETPEGIQRWNVPLFKSVMSGIDPNNKTGLLADRLNQYKMAPRPNGRIAVLTTVYNEPLMLPLWAKFYSKEFGAENLFVIDHESTTGVDFPLPEAVNIYRVPRDEGDSYLNLRMVSLIQRFLLETYDSVIYVDSDEFLCADPEVLAGRSLRQFLLELPDPIGMATGYNLHHNVVSEEAYDLDRPLLAQRRIIIRETMMDKPAVSRVPLNWCPGFHYAREGGTRVNGLYLLHLRWFDLNQALQKGSKYRDSKWSLNEISQGLAPYNRDEAEKIVDKFRGWSTMADRLGAADFDPQAQMTVVPSWMRSAIWI